MEGSPEIVYEDEWERSREMAMAAIVPSVSVSTGGVHLLDGQEASSLSHNLPTYLPYLPWVGTWKPALLV